MKIHHKISHGESIAKENTNCVSCGEKFSYYPSEKPGKFCESCVDSGDYRDISGLENNWGRSGKDNPNYQGGDFVSCSWCSDDTWASPWEIEERDNIFCSADCCNEWRSENYQGESNPFWKGGYNPNYSDGWWSARRRARQRDDGECQICGAEESKDGRRCDIHHKKPVREFDDPSDAHYLENLVTLCRSCHNAVENGDQKI